MSFLKEQNQLLAMTRIGINSSIYFHYCTFEDGGNSLIEAFGERRKIKGTKDGGIQKLYVCDNSSESLFLIDENWVLFF